MPYLELVDLLHHGGAQKYCGALLPHWIILSRWLLRLLSYLLLLLPGLILLLLEKLVHLEDPSKELVHFYLHALAIQVLEGTVHPSFHTEDETLKGGNVFGGNTTDHRADIRPVLCALPLDHKCKQLLIWFDTFFDGLHFRVTCLVPFVKGLLFVNEDDLLLSLLKKFLNRSDICDILPKK